MTFSFRSSKPLTSHYMCIFFRSKYSWNIHHLHTLCHFDLHLLIWLIPCLIPHFKIILQLMVFLDKMKTFVVRLNTIGQYHGKDPWYLEYHGVGTVHTFTSSYPHVYMNLLNRTCVYFLKFQLCHSSTSELLCLWSNSLSHVDTSCWHLHQVGCH